MWKWYFKFRVYLAFIPSLSLSVTHTLTPDRLEEDSRVKWGGFFVWFFFWRGGGSEHIVSKSISQSVRVPTTCLKFKKVQLHCLSLSRFHTQL